MKRSKRGLLTIALLGVGILIGSYVVTKADGLMPTNQPGSVDDPLITKSYVDQKIQQAVNDAVKTGNGGTGSGSGGSGSVAPITVIQLKPGQMLYAGSGTEFIVRTGTTIAFSNTTNGIPDVTGGRDLPKGTVVPLNHQLIFPSEGRGIQVDPNQQGGAYVMVRGKYSITNR